MSMRYLFHSPRPGRNHKAGEGTNTEHILAAVSLSGRQLLILLTLMDSL